MDIPLPFFFHFSKKFVSAVNGFDIEINSILLLFNMELMVSLSLRLPPTITGMFTFSINRFISFKCSSGFSFVCATDIVRPVI